MTELRQEMIRQMKLRNFSKRTQDSYIYQIKNLARHFNRSPDKLSHKELQDYLIYLKEERNLSFRSCNVARSAIRFLYGKVLEDQEICLSIPSQRTPKFLPEVLSVEEVKDIISATTTLRNRLLLMAAYSGGLRLGELVALGVRHIDSKRMVIRMISVGSRKCWGIATSQRRWFTSMYHGKVFPGFSPLWISMISKQIRRWRMEKAVDQKESVAPNQQSRIEVADIFRHYIGDYQKVYKLHPDHYKVVMTGASKSAIFACSLFAPLLNC